MSSSGSRDFGLTDVNSVWRSVESTHWNLSNDESVRHGVIGENILPLYYCGESVLTKL